MNSTTIKKINTDILVIGGGAAGIRAAIEADEQGANVLIVVKGNFCESGSTFYPLSPGWGMQASFGYVDADDSRNEHLKEFLTQDWICSTKNWQKLSPLKHQED